MTPSPYFSLESLSSVTVIILRLDADLDISAFNDITRDLIEQWPVQPGKNVIVDIGACRYMGSVLLGLLINVRQRTHAGGGEVIVSGASSKLTQVFRTAHFGRLIPLASSRAEALEMLSA